jgi:hypothetical protein
MRGILQDLSYSLRLAVRLPGFTFMVVLTLALGIGASTAVFTVIDAVLLHPVPYPDPGRIVSVLAIHPEQGPDRVSLTPADFLALREHNRSFLQLGAYVPFGSLDLTGEGEPVCSAIGSRRECSRPWASKPPWGGCSKRMTTGSRDRGSSCSATGCGGAASAATRGSPAAD